ncbi:MAG: 50S ribosomal protein L29 [Candidatus Eremiobacteraeota bacterium]|nr:50S ribosomal protein L29 [Candidatus Eremiobacteraeota bacterium]
MKKSEWKALRELTLTELQTKARETKEELFNLRFQLRTGHLSDFSKIKQIRRTYAQIQTLISDKRLSEAKHGAA